MATTEQAIQASIDVYKPFDDRGGISSNLVTIELEGIDTHLLEIDGLQIQVYQTAHNDFLIAYAGTQPIDISDLSADKALLTGDFNDQFKASMEATGVLVSKIRDQFGKEANESMGSYMDTPLISSNKNP